MAVSWLSLQGPWRATALDRRLMLSRALMEGLTVAASNPCGVIASRTGEKSSRTAGRRAATASLDRIRVFTNRVCENVSLLASVINPLPMTAGSRALADAHAREAICRSVGGRQC